MADMTLDEIAEQVKAPAAAPSFDEIKLEGDDIPDYLRGKSVKEAIAFTDQMRGALHTTEVARQAASAALEATKATNVTTKVEEPKELTREEIAELHTQDPLAAIEYMQKLSDKRATANMEARFGPMGQSLITASEQQARSKYELEFQLFGNDIQNALKEIPDKSILANPAVWDDVVSYIRGKTGNLEKYIEAKTNPGRSSTDARSEQSRSVGFSANSFVPSGTANRGGPQLSDFEREICRVQNISESDYMKYKDKD